MTGLPLLLRLLIAFHARSVVLMNHAASKQHKSSIRVFVHAQPSRGLPSLPSFLATVSPASRGSLLSQPHLSILRDSWLFREGNDNRTACPPVAALPFQRLRCCFFRIYCTALPCFPRAGLVWYRKLTTSRELPRTAIREASKTGWMGRQQSDCIALTNAPIRPS